MHDADSTAMEILSAELHDAGCEGCREEGNVLHAWFSAEAFNEEHMQRIFLAYTPLMNISVEQRQLKEQNWNALWENNFSLVEITPECLVRASFHAPSPLHRLNIVIDPKMSFGTGHHATTKLMAQYVLSTDMTNKRVFDIGCGTGILAILAAKQSAAAICAVDNDTWAYVNSKENMLLNNVPQVEVFYGGLEILQGKTADIILANINKNILLSHIPAYSIMLASGRMCFLSGIFFEDKTIIDAAAAQHGLSYVSYMQHNEWIAVYYRKIIQ
mgnify:CR=1 FL=1